MAEPTLSVAMCTFNGARHVLAQLESFAAQTRRPDEVVVWDDHSADNTPAIVREFAAKAPFPVRLTVNPQNLGTTANFAGAISACNGSIIALADQDDVWLPEKLATIEAALLGPVHAGVAFSDAHAVDDQLNPLGYRLWESVNFNPADRQRLAAGRAMKVLLKRNVATGATMAFFSEFRDLILPIPPGWVHDGWIAAVIGAVAGCAVVSQPLIHYRQHAAQQLGAPKRTLQRQIQVARQMDRVYFRKLGADWQAVADRLASCAHTLPDPHILARIDAKAAHCRARARMRERQRLMRLPIIMGELVRLRYHRFSLGWKGLAADLFL